MFNLKLFSCTESNRVNGALALAIISLIVLGCTCNKNLGDLSDNSTAESTNKSDPFNSGDEADAGDDKMPGDRLLKALIKETTADFALAISTNDFTKIHDKASVDFQKSIPVERLEKEFKIFVDRKSQYLPSLAKVSGTEPEFDSDPSLRSEQGLDILMVKGKYPTKPVEINFDYEYVKRGGQWKLLKLVVKM